MQQRLVGAALVILLIASLLLGVQSGEAAPESIILVNTASDVFDVAGSDCSTVTIADLPGTGGTVSLCEAICASNNTAAGAPHTINFSIGSGVQTITLASRLPDITRPVTINGASQPGYAGTPLIVLDGTYSVSAGLWVTAGSTTIRGLVIQRFRYGGINLESPGGNTIQGNYIGTDPTGSVDRGNESGIVIWESSDNLIGGASPGQGNLISGNFEGVFVWGNTNLIQGNRIGTNAAGTLALGNDSFGVDVRFSSTGNTIGGSVAGEGNLISGNREGIGFYESGNNFVLGNKIGTDASGTAALPNLYGGINLYQARNNVIGGTAPGAGNLISGNNGSGITLLRANRNQIVGNRIGTDASGASALPNAGPGIRVVSGSIDNHIGGATSGAGNLISGNLGSGVYIGARNTILQGNKIGTNLNGTAAIPNQRSGVFIDHGNRNIIGGLNSGEGNLISGNLEAGLVIDVGGRNQVLGNQIGTNAAGTAAVGNGQNGVIMKSCGTNTVQGNLISGNDGYGVSTRQAYYTHVEGNKIGTNATGSAALPNTYGGVELFDARHNSIGWTQGNLISGNGGPGVLISGDNALNNAVTNNKIGVDLGGNLALGNLGDGITISNSPWNMIGGETAGQGNLIAANNGAGVQIYGQGANGNLLFDNQIGLGANGSALGNALEGVLITEADDNMIGKASWDYGRANTIAHNRRAGVAIVGDAWSNHLSQNAIFSNRGLGIDLGADSGVQANDILDNDAGPNGYQNYPELFGLSNPTTSLSVVGTLNSAVNTTYTLDFYASVLCDRSGHGEGQQWLGSGRANTDGSGVANFNINLGVPLPEGKPFITATASDDFFNTSEFSACYPQIDVIYLPFVRR